MAQLAPRFSVTFMQPNAVCILDPALALGDRGLHSLLMVQHLASLVEFWVPRECWHLLDNYICYLEPHLSNAPVAAPAHSDALSLSPTFDEQSLQAWERFRLKTDFSKPKVCWLADEVGQSWLPAWLKEEASAEDILTQYELLGRALESRISQSALQEPFTAAFRDTAALAATLGSAVILTFQPAIDRLPFIVEQLEHWQIDSHYCSPQESLTQREIQAWQSYFMNAGLAKLLWTPHLRLAIAHLSVPHALKARLLLPSQEEQESSSFELGDPTHRWGFDAPEGRFEALDDSLWQDAQCYWYPLSIAPSNHYENPTQSQLQASFTH